MAIPSFGCVTSTPQPSTRFLGQRMSGDPCGRRVAYSLLFLVVRSRRSLLPEGPPKPSRLRRPALGEPGVAMGSFYFRPVPGVRFFEFLQRVVRRLLSL